MNILLYLACALMFLLGQALQLFWLKIPALRERCRVSNIKFSFRDYWSSDWNLIIGTFILLMLILLGLDEIIKVKPKILEIIKWTFAGIGFMAQSVILAKLSKYEKSLLEKIDAKTDIADGIIKDVLN